MEDVSPVERATQTVEFGVDMSTQTHMCCADIDVLQAQSQALLQESPITELTFKNNNERTHFYTGLPSFAVLMLVFELVKSRFLSRTSVSRFQQLLIVLFKLRLNLRDQDIAYRFVPVLWKTMPMQFRIALESKVAVIIDCFEVFCEWPSSLEARAQLFSNYKHHNTVKFLIGCTPCGSISYLSAALEGCGTDKTITLTSDFFDYLLPGDVILADRGFDIKDDAGFYGCEAKIPAFKKGKQQLSALEVETTRKIAHLRIHMERVIGGVRQKYSILSSTLPIEYMTTDSTGIPKVDKIARTCCALFNLCPAIVRSG
ncbi:uncharacterized protein [Antedon mediterranea]|uniref:uncharacterized protein n=1 Tax=Antedon mediterranea TaxID=105859 RepID=UPI003AF6D9B4